MRLVHDAEKRSLSETPPHVVVLAGPDPSADMLTVILKIPVITVMVAVYDS